MKFSLLFLFLIWITCLACNPKIVSSISKEYPVLEYNEEVVVLSLDPPKPSTAEELGEIKINDTGFTTNCSYIMVLNEAKIAARKVGGNAIKIIRHKKPNFWSSCHRMDVIVLRTKI